eukprot:2879817-Rhodomonas_salina.3
MLPPPYRIPPAATGHGVGGCYLLPTWGAIGLRHYRIAPAQYCSAVPATKAYALRQYWTWRRGIRSGSTGHRIAAYAIAVTGNGQLPQHDTAVGPGSSIRDLSTGHRIA